MNTPETAHEHYRTQLLKEFLNYLDQYSGLADELSDYLADADDGADSVVVGFIMQRMADAQEHRYDD